MPIDGRAHVLGMEFGVGDLLLRYDFFLILLEQTNYSYFLLKENHNAHQNQIAHWIVNVIGSILILVYF
jgi:hypothetical protein